MRRKSLSLPRLRAGLLEVWFFWDDVEFAKKCSEIRLNPSTDAFRLGDFSSSGECLHCSVADYLLRPLKSAHK